MSKSYKIKVNQGPGEAKFVDIPQVAGGSKPLAVKAEQSGKYQLLDATTGYAPENIRASRSGKNLQVFFEGRNLPDLVIEDYYEVTPEGFNGLIGESESGRFYEYIPETAIGNSAVPLLADGSNQVGMALGGAEINASGAAVGVLVAAAGLNPLLLAPLALLGGGGGGGGAGAGGGTTDNKSATVTITKATLDTGVSDSDFVTKGPVTEFSGTLSNFTGTPGDKVKLELLDKDAKPLNPALEGTVTPTALNGVWTWKWTPVDKDAATNLPEVLNDGNYTLKATIVTSAGVALTHATASATQALVIDTLSNQGDNKDAVLSITSVSDDTGTLKNDWLTSDTTLVFKGALNKFSPTLGDQVMLELDPVAEGPTLVQYVTPVQNNGVWGWEWDAQKTPFAQGTYKLTATLVDKAGNVFTHVGAKSEQDLVIDTTGPQGDKGLSIIAMSVDSGVGSFNPLDPSRKDFKTNDKTPEFTGTLSAALPAGEQIAVQLEKDGVVVESGFATVSGTGWTWAPKAPLADATYKLNAQVVDAAGNPATAVVNGVTGPIAPASKDVVIDTKGPTDGTDPNSGLKISAISISADTAANNNINNDFVTSDGSNKSPQINEDDKLAFTGTLNSGFDKNGGKVLVQIVGMDGEIKSSAYVEPTGINWTYEHIGALAEGQYLAKTILFDPVGNMISAKDQSFLIDKTSSDKGSSKPVSNSESTIVTYNDYYFEFYEYGHYKFENSGLIEYGGGQITLPGAKAEYAAGTFKLDFWDQAGNITTIENTGQTWKFGSPVGNPTQGSLVKKDFTGLQAVGPVGKYDVSSDFDMASLYDGISAVADQGAASQVVLSNIKDVVLTLSMGDVLALGVTNSFSVANVDGAKHKEQIQMRIDGQTGDKLNLDGLVNGLNLAWTGGQPSSNVPLTLGVEQYNVYTNTVLGVALFVDKDITVNVM
jgi:hypothetical protein